MKKGFLIGATAICIFVPMSRLINSPTIHTGRAVDLLLVFAAGTFTGVLLAVSASRFSVPPPPRK